MSIETVARTEEMRHVPRLALLIEKLDHDARSRIETLYSSCFETARTLDSGTLSELENIFRQVCRWLERLGEQARGRRGAQSHESNLHARVRSALSFAIEALTSLDETQFRRRIASNAFERSRGECVYASFLVVMYELERLAKLAATIDPDVTMKLIEPPYQLDPPPPIPEEEELATTT
jgi:hypothetical protein